MQVLKECPICKMFYWHKRYTKTCKDCRDKTKKKTNE